MPPTATQKRFADVNRLRIHLDAGLAEKGIERKNRESRYPPERPKDTEQRDADKGMDKACIVLKTFKPGIPSSPSDKGGEQPEHTPAEDGHAGAGAAVVMCDGEDHGNELPLLISERQGDVKLLFPRMRGLMRIVVLICT